MKISVFPHWLVVLLCLPIMAPVRADLTGKVLRILDGDTVEMLTMDLRTFRVRLTGIDAPEQGQPWGRQAKRRLAALVTNRVVKVSDGKQDSYGRTLGTLWIAGRDVNAILVSEGLAWAYRFRNQPVAPAYVAMERKARLQKRGLWQDVAPVPPWIWRKQSAPDILHPRVVPE